MTRQRHWTLWAFSLALAFAVGCGGSSDPAPSGSGGPNDPAPEPTAEPAPEPTAEPAPEPTPAPEDPACETEHETTFAAIQSVIFEQQGCTAAACHGDAAAGGLDLGAEGAYDALRAEAVGRPFAYVEPTKVNESYLYHKLAAATAPEMLTEPIAGSPMPLGAPIPWEHLEALRLWIEVGAPETGVVGDEFGGSRIADLLGTCLPPPEPVELEPLAPPALDEGVQMVLPPHHIDAGSEVEICFAEYYDFRDQIPDEFETEDRNFFYVNGGQNLADPNTHHLTLSFSGFRADMVDAPEFGTWTCTGGDMQGEECDPLDLDYCGEGRCRSRVGEEVACVGFGPPGGNNGATPGSRLEAGNGREGYYAKFPSHGIFYWNSHAFNLSTEDLMHRSWHNYYFTSDLRFQEVGFQDTRYLWIAAGTPAFTKQEYCAEYVLPKGTEILALFSHTHKRGERFTMRLKNSEDLIYDNPFWDDPLIETFDPPRVFDSEDPADRTIEYCALYNNGVKPDGSLDVDMVKRCSRTPPRSGCEATHCAEGRVGEPCGGVGDDATCDSSPGAGDGFCDAGSITQGLTSDDEMFVFLATAVVKED